MADPTSDSLTDPTTAYLGSLGIVGSAENPVDPSLITFVTDELDAHQGAATGLAGFNVTDAKSASDFMNVAGFAESYAAITGFQHMPTATTIANMIQNVPTGGWDALSASQHFYSQMPAADQAKFPNAQFNMTNQQYWQSAAQYLDSMEQLTNTRSLPESLLNQALSENWSGTDMTQYLQQNGWVHSIAPWTKYNMSYSQWQQYKVDNQTAITQRYGLNAANDQGSYIANLANPLTKFNAQDAQSPTTTTTGYTQARGGLQTHESEAR